MRNRNKLGTKNIKNSRLYSPDTLIPNCLLCLNASSRIPDFGIFSDHLLQAYVYIMKFPNAPAL
jgi:hypothetical protein